MHRYSNQHRGLSSRPGVFRSIPTSHRRLRVEAINNSTPDFLRTDTPSSTSTSRSSPNTASFQAIPVPISSSKPPSRPVPPLSSVRVPHCGYHYDGEPRRFFEGWYWKVGQGGRMEQRMICHAPCAMRHAMPFEHPIRLPVSINFEGIIPDLTLGLP